MPFNIKSGNSFLILKFLQAIAPLMPLTSGERQTGMSETVLQHPGQLLGGHLPVLPAGEYLSLICQDGSRDLNTDL